jgi:hypothetical protein
MNLLQNTAIRTAQNELVWAMSFISRQRFMQA